MARQGFHVLGASRKDGLGPFIEFKASLSNNSKTN